KISYRYQAFEYFNLQFGSPSKFLPLTSSTPNSIRLPPPQGLASRDPRLGLDHQESVIPALARQSQESRFLDDQDRVESRNNAFLMIKTALFLLSLGRVKNRVAQVPRSDE